MSIKNIILGTAGADNIVPRICYIDTDNTIAEVTTAGFLNASVQAGYAFEDTDICLVTTQTSLSATSIEVGWFEITKSGANTSLTSAGSPGAIALPTVANQIAYATDTVGALGAAGLATALFNGGNISAGKSGTAGALFSFPATLAKGSLKLAATASSGDTVTTITNALQAAARTFTIPDGGQTASNFLISDSATTQHITTGALQVDAGVVSTGLATGGTAGGFIAYPSTTTNGSLRLTPVGNVGNFNTIVSDITGLGQSQTITIPDAGAATAQFLLSTGTANIIAQQQFVGLNSILLTSAGTWTRTRVAQGNYALVHTPADDTGIIGIDITPIIRATAAKGFRLDSFDVIYSIGSLAMDAHTLTLDRIAYANNVAVSVTSVPLTGSLSVATQAQPYMTNIAVTTPAFDVTADTKYVLEVTANNAATTDYSFYGVMLRFSQTIG